MNKRKRNILTTDESIPNEVIVSDQITQSVWATTSTDAASGTLGEPLDCPADAKPAGTSSRDQIKTITELGQGSECANWPESVTGPLSQPRWEEPTLIGTLAGSGTVYRPGGLPVTEERLTQAGIHEDINQGIDEGAEGGTDPWVLQGTDVADNLSDTHKAFWHLLRDAGYDTW